MKMGIAIQTGGPLAVGGTKDIVLSPEEARELWEKLGVLFGKKQEAESLESRVRAFQQEHKIERTDDSTPKEKRAQPTDTGRTVWAADGAGNSISPDELKARNRERSDKWAEIGDKFAAEAKPDYYTDCEAGIWQEFKGLFEARWLKTGDNSFVMMNGNKVHSLCWGNPYKSYGIRQRWDCVNGFTE